MQRDYGLKREYTERFQKRFLKGPRQLNKYLREISSEGGGKRSSTKDPIKTYW